MKAFTKQVAAIGLLALLAAATDTVAEQEWPRTIPAKGGDVILYQPQIDKLAGTTLSARAAVSVTKKGATEPVFGAVWVEARIATDTDSRQVGLLDIRVVRVRFSDATEAQEQELAALIEEVLPSWNLSISQDRLLTALDLAERKSEANDGFENKPPKIIFMHEPAVLVTIDGAPLLVEIENSALKAVANTPFMIISDPRANRFYLYGGSDTWYGAHKVEGPWFVTTTIPEAVRQLQPQDDAPEPNAKERPPKIIVATEPTELIVTDGKPAYVAIGTGELMAISNTETDVIMEPASKQLFVLLSGRWYAAPHATGPWTYLEPEKLPPSFKNIPEDSDYGYLLTWVPGTQLAEEAILDASIPQTAAVKRDATIEVTYDGKPQFESIEGTSLRYALNTEFQVIEAGQKYYCAHEGVWYESTGPNGPWTVATSVPEEIHSIPPSCPVYNTRYVYIYDSTPEVVYVGYYPGYLHSYVYHGCVVYGTGWRYRPWRSVHAYYPCHRTWGFHVRWNPWRGWAAGFSYSTGRYNFSLSRSTHAGWWGPGGYHHGYRHGYRHGYQRGYQAAKHNTARNLYRTQDVQKRHHTAATLPRGERRPAERPNNVFTDSNGNVYRRDDAGNWLKRDEGKWQRIQAADRTSTTRAAASTATALRPEQLPSRPATQPVQRPTAGTGDLANRARNSQTWPPATQTRPSSTWSGSQPANNVRQTTGASNHTLNRDYQARQRGTQRSTSFQKSGYRPPANKSTRSTTSKPTRTRQR
jgi:hypothetical protein